MGKEKQSKFLDISIIIVTYNSSWLDLKETIDSIIEQEEISFEIIIADDGSEDNQEGKIKNYFLNKQITNYKLILNKENKGTVCNLFSGLQLAQGEYIKDISPGDLLVGKSTLKNWINFLKSNKLEWAFSDAIYYRKKNEEKIFISIDAHPNDMVPYVDCNVGGII